MIMRHDDRGSAVGDGVGEDLTRVLLRAEAEGGYRIVAGERRWRAAALAGLTNLPARVLNVSSLDRKSVV